MTTFLGENKSNTIDKLYVFLLIIYAGNATIFVRSLNSWENIIGLFLPILFAVIVSIKNRISVSRKLLFLIIGYAIYNFLLTIKFQTIHPRFFGIYLINFSLAYVAFSSLKFRFFKIYEDILLYLCIIALFFWGIQLLIPNTLSQVFDIISFSQPGSGNVSSNIIVYTIGNSSAAGGATLNFGFISLVRNSGFAWEPGAFACFINLAIFINLIRTKFKISGNLRILLFLATLISTFSTTGFAILVVILFFYAYNQHFNYTVLASILIVGVGLYVFTLPFMNEKIIDASEYNTEEIIENSPTDDRQYIPQRFESLQIDFIDFLNHPLLGLGGHQDARWTNKLGVNIATISGLGKVISIFGIVGIIFFFFSLYQTSKEFSRHFKFNGWFFQYAIIIMISISYSIIFTPLLMCFWLTNSSYYTRKDKRKHLLDQIKLYFTKQKVNNYEL